ncbi:hypothetical protein ZHAS_00015020 [Anopheles sinensis]|uniref:Uncharacterized protein n=1 Tax=Anopheles sinensis TaxID=74873 RepID=A0A084W9W3_ANOSI|nr:hypothetical protein ZHAS_00015020 [Anopheles sinensis]
MALGSIQWRWRCTRSSPVMLTDDSMAPIAYPRYQQQYHLCPMSGSYGRKDR